MTTLDMDNLVVDGRLNLTPELSARLGVPNGVECWRYILARAASDPEGFCADMRNMDNSSIHFLLTLFDQLEGIARRNPGLILPITLDADLHALLDDVRRNVRAEASRRGVTLVPWATAEGVRQ
jgi:hypothetical protein